MGAWHELQGLRWPVFAIRHSRRTKGTFYCIDNWGPFIVSLQQISSLSYQTVECPLCFPVLSITKTPDPFVRFRSVNNKDSRPLCSFLCSFPDAVIARTAPVFLAATIVHEMAHGGQVPAVYKGWWRGEQGAYQVESDFLRARGIAGTVSQLARLFPGTDPDYLRDQADFMAEYRVANPAITKW
jgi:hypothetical protein